MSLVSLLVHTPVGRQVVKQLNLRALKSSITWVGGGDPAWGMQPTYPLPVPLTDLASLIGLAWDYWCRGVLAARYGLSERRLAAAPTPLVRMVWPEVDIWYAAVLIRRDEVRRGERAPDDADYLQDCLDLAALEPAVRLHLRWTPVDSRRRDALFEEISRLATGFLSDPARFGSVGVSGVLNPVFPAGGLVGGADGDFLLDGTLWDSKVVTGPLTFRSPHWGQLLGYYVLAAASGIPIDRVGVYYARHGMGAILEVEEVEATCNLDPLARLLLVPDPSSHILTMAEESQQVVSLETFATRE